MDKASDLPVHKTVVDILEDDRQSARAKYQQIYVGSGAVRDFLRYELLMLFLSHLPGAAGFALRKVFYGKIFAGMGHGTVIGPAVTLRSPGRMTLGAKVFIDSNVVMDARGDQSRISIGNNVLLGGHSTLSCAAGSITMADEVSIGPYCYVRASRSPVVLGTNVTIGAHSVIISGSPDYRRLDIPMMKQEGQARGIRIGDDVWVGVGARIIDGVTIGDGCVIGAGAVVTRDVPAFSIAAGVPAKVLKQRKTTAAEEVDRV